MPLSVKAASNAYAINMHGRSDGYSELYGSSSDGSTRYAFLQPHSSQTRLYTLVNTPLIFGTNSTERMRIDNSGRVGINRTPAIANSKLEISGADNVPLAIVEASGYTGGIGIGSTGFQFFHGTSKRMTINANYVIPKMNFNYSNSNTGPTATTGDELNQSAGTQMLKQQITVAAGSRVMVWAQSGQIGQHSTGGYNPQMAIYIDSNGTSPVSYTHLTLPTTD